MSESRKAKEERWALEYAAYVERCKTYCVEAINFQNWMVNKKIEEAGGV